MTSDPTCDINQAMAAVSYFRHAFGGWALPEQEERAFLRMCREFTPAEVQAAIDQLVMTAGRRPSVNEVAQKIRSSRPKPERRHGDAYVTEIPETDLTNPDEFPSRIAEIREQAALRR